MRSRVDRLTPAGRSGARGLAPMRRVLTMDRRLPLAPVERGVGLKTSCPSWKKRRFSGKKVSLAVRFTTTLSDSVEPKSGLAAAVSWKLLDGRQNTSKPAL